MKKLKLPQELSLEELLAAALTEDNQDESPEMEITSENPFISFLQTFNIKSGRQKVNVRSLYQFFVHWSGHYEITHVSFIAGIRKFISVSMINTCRYAHINISAYEFEDIVTKFKNFNRRKVGGSKFYIAHFNNFLNDTGIASGDIYVEYDILYYVYGRWCDSIRRKVPLSQGAFLRLCELHFDKKYLSVGFMPWFKINEQIKQLITKEEISRWREGRSKYGKVKTEKTNNKEKRFQKQRLYHETFKEKEPKK